MTAVQSSVKKFRAAIERRLGLNFDDDKNDYLADIMHSRMRKHGLTGPSYLNQLEIAAGNDEWLVLGQLLTIPETYFFRHCAQFQAFADVALRDRMLVRRETRRLSLLSAGCASGEEAYTMAMMVREAGIDASWNVFIQGVDINATVIEKARAGRYSAWSLRETSADMAQKWFKQQGRDFVIDDTIRAAVRFEVRNIAGEDTNPWPEALYDIIFCRNVLMYFSERHMCAALNRLTRALAPGGYLFLGHAETLRGVLHDFHVCHTHDTFYYQRREFSESKSPVKTDQYSGQQFHPLTVPIDSNDTWVEAIRKSTDRIQALADSRDPVSGRENEVDARQGDLLNARRLLHQERFSEALDAIESLPANVADKDEALLLKAVLYAHNGQLPDAERVCRILLERNELDAGAQYVLALCREEIGDSKAALYHNQIAAHLDPQFAMPRLHLGLIARRAGDCESARRELAHAVILLQQEEHSRLLLFGGGFSRDALLALCRGEIAACGGRS